MAGNIKMFSTMTAQEISVFMKKSETAFIAGSAARKSRIGMTNGITGASNSRDFYIKASMCHPSERDAEVWVQWFCLDEKAKKKLYDFILSKENDFKGTCKDVDQAVYNSIQALNSDILTFQQKSKIGTWASVEGDLICDNSHAGLLSKALKQTVVTKKKTGTTYLRKIMDAAMLGGLVMNARNEVLYEMSSGKKSVDGKIITVQKYMLLKRLQQHSVSADAIFTNENMPFTVLELVNNMTQYATPKETDEWNKPLPDHVVGDADKYRGGGFIKSYFKKFSMSVNYCILFYRSLINAGIERRYWGEVIQALNTVINNVSDTAMMEKLERASVNGNIKKLNDYVKGLAKGSEKLCSPFFIMRGRVLESFRIAGMFPLIVSNKNVCGPSFHSGIRAYLEKRVTNQEFENWAEANPDEWGMYLRRVSKGSIMHTPTLLVVSTDV